MSPEGRVVILSPQGCYTIPITLIGDIVAGYYFQQQTDMILP
ncbi:MAG: hypothetical protein WA254_00465 [Candidatus Sulfotelmatobacter sp.]